MNKTTTLISFLILVAAGVSGCGKSSAPPSRSAASAEVTEEMLQVAEQGDLSAIDKLLQRRVPADVRDSCDWTPMMKAALNGHLAVVERLLAAGAKVDAEDKGGYTPMMLAASNNHADVVELLLQRGANINHQEGTEGWTALIWAAKQGHTKTVETLLKRGPDATIKDFSGKTAADWAREADQVQALKLLESSGPTG